MTDAYQEKEPNFLSELTSLINKYSKENGSNTPDFILAAYLLRCLDTFNDIVSWREQWYGRSNQFRIEEPNLKVE